MNLTIKELKERYDIVDIISNYIEVKQYRGDNYKALCPFHNDTSPSLMINKNKQIYKCFACGSGGDMVDFIVNMGKTIPEAMEEIQNSKGFIPNDITKAISRKKKVEWKQVVPVHEPKEITHYNLKTPAQKWAYKTKNGRVLGYVCRFDLPENRKVVLPYIFATDSNKRLEWRWQGFESPRPLYDLNKVLDDKTKILLICEGEKTAECLKSQDLPYTVTTWMGGANSVKNTEFIILSKRKVILWADNDVSGIKAMNEIADILTLNDNNIKFVKNDESYPKGWDAADKNWEKGECYQYILNNLVDSLSEDEIIEKSDFPIEVFPQQLNNIIIDLNTTLNYSKDFISCAMMFSFAVMNGNFAKLKVKNSWVAPSIFWFAIVGDRGTMKSHPLSTIIKPLKEIDSRNKKEYDQEFENYELLTDAEKKDTKRPKFKQMLISDYTLEALHDIHVHNKKGLGLYKDELIGFINDMNKYRKGSDEQFWLESFNNGSYIVNRVSKTPLMVEDININIIGTIQPDVLNSFSNNYIASGMIDRFLFTTCETEIFPMNLEDNSKDLIDWWSSFVKSLNNDINENYLTEGSYILECNEDVLNSFVFYDKKLVEIQKDKNTNAYITNYCNKMKTYMPRFALLLVIIEESIEGCNMTIRTEHVDNAWKLVQYFINSARFIFSTMDKSAEINSIKNTLSGSTKAEQTFRLLDKGFKQSEVAATLNVSKQYISKLLKEKSTKKSTKVN